MIVQTPTRLIKTSMSEHSGTGDGREEGSLDTVTISKGTVVVYRDGDGETADTVTEIEDEFVRVNSSRTGSGDRWLHISDIFAVGVYGDEAKWVLAEE